MVQSKQPGNTINVKLLIIFALVLFLSYTFWFVNRNAFKEISNVIEQLSSPNQKQLELEVLNANLSKYISSHRQEALRNERYPSEAHFEQILEIDRNIDSLEKTFKNEKDQLERFQLLDSIFLKQNKVFENYLKARYYYLNNNVRSEELASLSEDIRNSNLITDSNVVSEETTTKTYTLLPPIKIPVYETETRRNSKKPKYQELQELTELQFLIEQQKDIRSDTTTVQPQQDSLIQKISNSISRVDKLEKTGRNLLREQEIQLLSNNELLIDQLFEVLTKVKQEEVLKTKLQTQESVRISNNTIQKTKYVSILFILVALILLVFILMDLSRINTYRKQLEISKEQAEFSSLAKQRFLSNMSHEIRTPLQSIIGYSEMIEHTSDNSNPILALKKSSNHLLSVVNEMLDFSKIISGKLVLQNEPFNVQELISELNQIFELDCEKKGLKWVCTTDTTLSEHRFLIGDRFRMRQILYNLVGNAIKYTQKGNIHLSVDSKIHGEFLELNIHVKDTGNGISEDKLTSIFEEYEQAGKDHSIGTGLGLSIVKKITDEMLGKIEVESKIDQGSHFKVNLKLKRSEEIIQNEEEFLQKSIIFNGEIWVVDDDELILQLCGYLLKELQIEHRLFGSAESLLEQEWRETTRLVITDFRLPNMTGIELLEKLRIEHPQLKMIALTAQVLPEEQSELMHAGFNDLLLKPFKRNEFLSLLSRYSSPFDLKNLKSMIDDPSELLSIIEQFKLDTRADLEQLKNHLLLNEFEGILSIVHRLAGRIGQLGAIQISNTLKSIEQEGRKNLILTPETLTHLEVLISEIEEALTTI